MTISETKINQLLQYIRITAFEEFTEGTRRVLELCDRLAAEATEEQRKAMTEAYLIAAEYEWAFWNWGYYGDEKK